MAEQHKLATQFRIAGASYEQIGERMGVSTRSAWRYVQAALANTRAVACENAAEVREIELRRIDAQLVALWGQRSDPRVSDSITRLGLRRDTLLGLAAATKHELTGADGAPLLEKIEVVFVMPPGGA